MRISLRVFVFAPVLVGLASGACTQSNLTTGSQPGGAVYDLYMPEMSCWNGGIVVFAHGYVQPGLPIGVPQDQLTIGGLSLPATFNQLGYGFAASSFSTNGLAIVQGVSDTEELVENILRPQLKPSFVYLIGASEGGLVRPSRPNNCLSFTTAPAPPAGRSFLPHLVRVHVSNVPP